MLVSVIVSMLLPANCERMIGLRYVAFFSVHRVSYQVQSACCYLFVSNEGMLWEKTIQLGDLLGPEVKILLDRVFCHQCSIKVET